MIVLGLTGSIAMGKTRSAQFFKRLGVPVFDSDAAARRATAPGGVAVAAVLAVFPDAAAGGTVDRAALARRVFSDRNALRSLEVIVHPHVAAARNCWLRHHALARTPVVVIDVPLLFETGSDDDCDAVLVASAPSFVQRQRALGRPDMDEARLNGVLARQMSAWEQRRRADAVIPTGLGKRTALLAIRRALRQYGPCPSGRPRPLR